MNISKLPGISYLRRYWWVILAILLGYLLADYGWEILDIFAYLPLVFALWVSGPLLFRNIFNRKTTDKYIDDKQYHEDFWGALLPSERVWFTMIQSGIYLLGSALIVHAVASNLFAK